MLEFVIIIFGKNYVQIFKFDGKSVKMNGIIYRVNIFLQVLLIFWRKLEFYI